MRLEFSLKMTQLWKSKVKTLSKIEIQVMENSIPFCMHPNELFNFPHQVDFMAIFKQDWNFPTETKVARIMFKNLRKRSHRNTMSLL